MHCFPGLIELSIFSWLLLSFFKIISLDYFSVNYHISISLGSVWEIIMSLVVLMFSCFFMFLMALHWCLYIWGSSHLFQPFQTSFSGQRLSPEGGWRALTGLCTVSSSWGGTVAWSLCISITWGQCWQRLQRSWRWQWWLRLLGSSEAKTAGVLLFFFWLMGGSSSWGVLSWHQILCACILSGIRTGILELGTHRSIIAPASWGTGVLSMAMVLVFWGAGM